MSKPKLRECQACLEIKPWTSFPHRTSRICTTCAELFAARGTKWCGGKKGCGRDRPTTAFGRDSAKADGLRQYCTECARATSAGYYARDPATHRARVAKYRAENPDKVRASEAKYRTENPDKKRAKEARYAARYPEKRIGNSAKWRANNPDRERATRAAYRAENPEVISAARARRRALLASAPGSWAEAKEYARLHFTGLPCAYRGLTRCGGGFAEIDHVTPLGLGGTHYPDNLLPACRACNSSKGGRTLDEWMKFLRIKHAALEQMKLLGYVPGKIDTLIARMDALLGEDTDCDPDEPIEGASSL